MRVGNTIIATTAARTGAVKFIASPAYTTGECCFPGRCVTTRDTGTVAGSILVVVYSSSASADIGDAISDVRADRYFTGELVIQ